MMFHACPAQMNHARLTGDLGQAPDVTIKLHRFSEISHAKLDATNSDYSRIDHWPTSLWRDTVLPSLTPLRKDAKLRIKSRVASKRGLAYRIQELAYGGLSEETLERLEAIADELEGKTARRCRLRANRPIAGTRLIREWKGVEHCVTVRTDDFEYQGRPYKSLSAIAKLITGTQWNGLVFFGLKNQGRGS